MELGTGRNRAVVTASFTVAALLAVYLELFHEAVVFERTSVLSGFLASSPDFSTMRHIAIAWAALSLVLLLIFVVFPRAASFAFRHRVIIGASLVAILTALDISGSSVAYWSSIVGGQTFQGTIFGIPRIVRSDEYLYSLPTAFSQQFGGYSSMNIFLRGIPTDVSFVEGQPAWTLSCLFRPFQWGYLILGSTHGLAFFWSARLICLFLISVEFGLFLTERNNWLALIYAMLISFAPFVQWWFAIEDVVGVLVFGQALVLLFDAYLKATTSRKRIWLALGLSWSAGCYALVLYPAWQISLAYGLGAIGIATFVTWLKDPAREKADAKIHLRRAIPLAGGIIALVVLLLFIVAGSMDSIRAVASTVYPGQRSWSGGGLLDNIGLGPFSSWSCLASPILGSSLYNPSEQSQFISLFPVDIILAGIAIARRRDRMAIAMLIAYVALLAYCAFEIPGPIAAITLLSRSTLSRMKLPLGVLETAMLIRSIWLLLPAKGEHMQEGAMGSSTAKMLAVALLSAAVVTLITRLCMGFKPPTILSVLIAIEILLACLSLALVLLRGRRYLPVFLVCLLIVPVAGICINPIQQGAAALTDSDYANKAKAVASQDQGAVWICDNSIEGQALVANGIRVIDSISPYPDMTLLRRLDPTGIYDNVYNRFTYYQVRLVRDASTSFFVGTSNTVIVALNVNDISKLGVSYWLSYKDLTEYDTPTTTFVPIAKSGDFTIYRIDMTSVQADPE